MDIFFADPSEIPLPPDKVRIRLFHAEPYADFTRLKVNLELDPFQRRPSLELRLVDPSGREAASAEIIETMTRKLELNLHLRIQPEPGEYTLTAVLYYSDPPVFPNAASAAENPTQPSAPVSPPQTSAADTPSQLSTLNPPPTDFSENDSFVQLQVDTAYFRFII